MENKKEFTIRIHEHTNKEGQYLWAWSVVAGDGKFEGSLHGMGVEKSLDSSYIAARASIESSIKMRVCDHEFDGKFCIKCNLYDWNNRYKTDGDN